MEKMVEDLKGITGKDLHYNRKDPAGTDDHLSCLSRTGDRECLTQCHTGPGRGSVIRFYHAAVRHGLEPKNYELVKRMTRQQVMPVWIYLLMR